MLKNVAKRSHLLPHNSRCVSFSSLSYSSYCVITRHILVLLSFFLVSYLGSIRVLSLLQSQKSSFPVVLLFILRSRLFYHYCGLKRALSKISVSIRNIFINSFIEKILLSIRIRSNSTDQLTSYSNWIVIPLLTLSCATEYHNDTTKNRKIILNFLLHKSLFLLSLVTFANRPMKSHRGHRGKQYSFYISVDTHSVNHFCPDHIELCNKFWS